MNCRPIIPCHAFYSARKLTIGLAIAALIAGKLTVATAISTDAKPVIPKMAANIGLVYTC